MIDSEKEFTVAGYAEVFFDSDGNGFVVSNPVAVRLDYYGDRAHLEVEPLSPSAAQAFSLSVEKLARFSAPSLPTGSYKAIGFVFGIECGDEGWFDIIDHRLVMACDKGEGRVSLLESDGLESSLAVGEEGREDFFVDFLQDRFEELSKWPHLAKWQARVGGLLS